MHKMLLPVIRLDISSDNVSLRGHLPALPLCLATIGKAKVQILQADVEKLGMFRKRKLWQGLVGWMLPCSVGWLDG